MFTALGTYATYRLGSLLYNKQVGLNAALLFASSLAIILSNHDVRTDTILVGSVAFGIWQLAAFVQNEKLVNVLLGGAGIALGVATKGMISVLVAGTAIFCHIAYLRKWRMLYTWKWLAGLVAFAVVIFPVAYCYYLQFDLHPEKVVNGARQQSGIKFLFWTQSFERLAGQRSMTSSPEFSFFYHTILWAILPWGLLVYPAVLGRIKYMWNLKCKPVKSLELLTLGGVVIMFHLMSASKFKLPHYLNILFPLLAVLLSSYLDNLFQNNKLKELRIFVRLQYFIVTLLVLGAVVLNAWFFPANNAIPIVGGMLLLSALIYLLLLKRPLLFKIIVPSVVAIMLLAFTLNTNFYPRLLKYQSGNEIAAIVGKNSIPKEQVYVYNEFKYSLDFYLQRTNPAMTLEQLKAKSSRGEKFYLVVYKGGINDIKNSALNLTKEYTTPQFHISRLDLKFLNPATRKQSLDSAWLFQIN